MCISYPRNPLACSYLFRRAYIAASRRSDRSLEARIESARRASEIHKKRTGRALRVTEQDVVNEEMYEEEDDDLPAQIRRLQSFAHLQTGSMEFNRRLQAYMSSQLGTRSALMEQGNFAQPYPNAPFFANQFGQPQQQQPQMLPPQMLHYSNQQLRHTPYPMSPHGYGHSMHHRPASISTTQELGYMHSNPTSPAMPQFNEEQRRMSLPPQSAPATPGSQGHPSIRPTVSRSTSHADGENTPSPPQNMFSGFPSQSHMSTATPTSGVSANAGGSLDVPQSMNLAPFSTSLPQETQQLLAQPSSMSAHGSFNPYWMPGNSGSFSYSYKPNSYAQPQSPVIGQQNFMNPTLSLNPLDTNVDSPAYQSYTTSATTTDGINTPFSGAFSNYDFAADGMFGESLKGPIIAHTSSGPDSGVVTPGGNGDWTNFLESFEDGSSGHVSA